jgi:hypothetical protein
MTSRDFCFWLQGFIEIQIAGRAEVPVLNSEQFTCVAKHLALVFKHEIDPSAGPPEHQAELDEIHASIAPHTPSSPLIRC